MGNTTSPIRESCSITHNPGDIGRSVEIGSGKSNRLIDDWIGWCGTYESILYNGHRSIFVCIGRATVRSRIKIVPMHMDREGTRISVDMISPRECWQTPQTRLSVSPVPCGQSGSGFPTVWPKPHVDSPRWQFRFRDW